MKLLIAGSREFNDYSLLKSSIKTKPSTIISGGTRGTDKLGEQYADEFGLYLDIYPAYWDKFGKKAGYIRNEIMGRACDVGIIFWDGKSKGTKNMIDILEKLGKPYKVVLYNDLEDDEF